MSEWPYRYAWGNNPVRARLKGKRCRILKTGRRMSVMVEFEDGTKVVTSRRALRKEQTDD